MRLWRMPPASRVEEGPTGPVCSFLLDQCKPPERIPVVQGHSMMTVLGQSDFSVH